MIVLSQVKFAVVNCSELAVLQILWTMKANL